MNKNAIKSYAVWARTELMKQVSQKAYEYGVTENSLPELNIDTINDRLLSSDEKSQLNELVREVRKNGFEHVIEEVAYTWFNRFIALRYMEVNNYLPRDLRVRVFTNENNEFKPEILSEALHLDMNCLDVHRVFDYIEQNKEEKLYKYLLLTLCNEMNEYLPCMFTSINDYKTLLFPDNLLKDDSVLARLISDIDEDSWLDQVQIIGWLYQYYNSELKDIVMKKKNYTKDDIPAATQLFTPDWIVRYMVENSLGRLYINKKKHEGIFEDGRDPSEMTIDEINEKRISNEKYISNEMGWKYYLPEAKQDAEVLKELEKIELEHSKLQPEDIKLIDPCMGSGHILVYAFDVLMDIYRDAGYSDRDASKSILENNLYGLEIDERAYHLAYFALMMKARQYNRRILSKDTKINLVEIVESSSELNEELLSRLGVYKELGQYLVNTFKEAKEFGSILSLDCTLVQLNELDNRLIEIDNNAKYGSMLDQIESQQLIDLIDPLLKQARLLVQKYDVVVTNPPYMAPNPKQKLYVQKHYKDYKADLFGVFEKKCHLLNKCNGYQTMIILPSYMFLSSFENARKEMLSNVTICSLLHMGRGIFGVDFGSTAFVLLNNKIENNKGRYFRLHERTFQYIDPDHIAQLYLDSKEDDSLLFDFQTYDTQNDIKYKDNGLKLSFITTQDNFKKIPGSPIAYWVSSKLLSAFQVGRPLSPVASPCVGLQTGDNGRFLRLWFEVCNQNISFDCSSCEESFARATRWFPYNKGGDFRKWYGNSDYIVNWENNGNEIRNFKDERGKLRSRPQNTQYYFKESATWSKISSGPISFRFKPRGFVFDVAGTSIFSDNKELLIYILGLCNTKIITAILKAMSPTLNYEVGQIASLPVILENEGISSVIDVTSSLIKFSKLDWDSFETSWDFKVHPLVELRLAGASARGDNDPSARVSSAYKAWSMACEERFNQLKANEEELNRIFIEIYGLQDELTPEVEDKDVTVRKADLVRDIKSFISYAVGCMFGRYSLDVEGLAYAGGEWDSSKYSIFIPDADDIIPICDEEYFEDDIVSRFVEFVSVVYGSDTLEENLKFIADALGGKGTPREVLRNYFLNDFFKDHCNTYQVTGSGKRPIYWLFDSGKKNGFKALVYIHRYTPDLIARMRTGYIHPQQARYRTQIELLQEQIDMAGSTSEKVKLSKQLKKINEQLLELNKYEEIVHHWADKMEPMDLDDGVKVNYAKFQELLAKIK